MFESQITTLEAAEPSVSDVALQLMVATLKGGDYSDWDTVFRSAEMYVREREARSKTGPAADLEKLAAMCESGKYEDGWAATYAGKRVGAR